MAWLALVCVLAQVGGMVHMAAVSHARCQVHGELLHANAPSVAADAGAASEPGRSFHAAPPAGDSDHEDDECSLVTAQRDSVAPSVVPAVAHVRALPPLALAGARALLAEPLYRLAPKNSPPDLV
jgi:hypothetical protein